MAAQRKVACWRWVACPSLSLGPKIENEKFPTNTPSSARVPRAASSIQPCVAAGDNIITGERERERQIDRERSIDRERFQTCCTNQHLVAAAIIGWYYCDGGVVACG